MNILYNIISFDNTISESILYLRSDFFNHFFFFITKFGSWYFIISFFVCVSLLLYIYKNRSYILPLFITIVGSGVTALIIKYLISRPRPGTNIALYTEIGSSFPSAHATLIFVFCGFIAYYVLQLNLALRQKIVINIFLTLIIILVGFSRIYLGVHFLSDVLAGYLIGFIWLIGVISFSKKMKTLDNNRF